MSSTCCTRISILSFLVWWVLTLVLVGFKSAAVVSVMMSSWMFLFLFAWSAVCLNFSSCLSLGVKSLLLFPGVPSFLQWGTRNSSLVLLSPWSSSLLAFLTSQDDQEHDRSDWPSHQKLSFVISSHGEIDDENFLLDWCCQAAKFPSFKILFCH